MGNLQPTEQMDRISRQYVGEHLDEIIERIDKEDIGFVITDENKKDLVICPAKWFSYCFDDDFGCIINSAVRYALGRETYMPWVVAEFVKKYMKILNEKTIDVILRDIKMFLEDDKNLARQDVWTGLYNELCLRKAELHK